MSLFFDFDDTPITEETIAMGKRNEAKAKEIMALEFNYETLNIPNKEFTPIKRSQEEL